MQKYLLRWELFPLESLNDCGAETLKPTLPLPLAATPGPRSTCNLSERYALAVSATKIWSVWGYPSMMQAAISASRWHWLLKDQNRLLHIQVL